MSANNQFRPIMALSAAQKRYKTPKSKNKVVQSMTKQLAGFLVCLPPDERVGWVIYLLEVLEALTPKHEKQAFTDGLTSLVQSIQKRLSTASSKR